MAGDLYILGTNHPLQCGSADRSELEAEAFTTELRRLCSELKILRIAEEMSEQGLKNHGVTETIGFHVAHEIGAAYQMVDLSIKERTGLCVDDSPVITTLMRYRIADGSGFREAFDDLADGVRERVWVARILSGNEWPVLFVCGANHSVSVRRLWRGLGLESKVEQIDYNP